MAKQAKLPGKETAEKIVELLKLHQPCSAQALVDAGANVSNQGVQSILGRMIKHGVIEQVAPYTRRKHYQLTGLSPLQTCKTCPKVVLRWNLVDERCWACRPDRKKCNQQVDADFEFLRNPAYRLIKQVFHPVEGL